MGEGRWSCHFPCRCSAPQPSISKVHWILWGGEAALVVLCMQGSSAEPSLGTMLLRFPGRSFQFCGAGWQPGVASPPPLTWTAPSSRLQLLAAPGLAPNPLTPASPQLEPRGVRLQ